MNSDDKLFLLDAYALIYRAYYAFIKSPRINSKGFNTSAILGFVGAGGLGQLLYFELSLFHYAQASTVIIAMLLLSVAVDWSSAALRRAMR